MRSGVQFYSGLGGRKRTDDEAIVIDKRNNNNNNNTTGHPQSGDIRAMELRCQSDRNEREEKNENENKKVQNQGIRAALLAAKPSKVQNNAFLRVPLSHDGETRRNTKDRVGKIDKGKTHTKGCGGSRTCSQLHEEAAKEEAQTWFREYELRWEKDAIEVRRAATTAKRSK